MNVKNESKIPPTYEVGGMDTRPASVMLNLFQHLSVWTLNNIQGPLTSAGGLDFKLMSNIIYLEKESSYAKS